MHRKGGSGGTVFIFFNLIKNEFRLVHFTNYKSINDCLKKLNLYSSTFPDEILGKHLRLGEGS